MRKPWKILGACLAISTALPASIATAETAEFCVSCEQPDKTYLCRVETPHARPGQKGLQLYCVIRTAKDGGHKSCAVRTETGSTCAGPIRTYTFQAPTVPPELRAAAERLRNSPPANGSDGPETLPEQKGGEPETLVDMTSRAVDASREGLQTTGETVRDAAGSTGEKIGTVGKQIGKTVGKAARGAGKGVGKAAKGVGTAAKTAGGAVSNTAKIAYECLRSLFEECGGSSEAEEEN